MTISLNEILLIVLDWTSSVLMMGSIWGWIYKRIDPLIEKKLVKSRRHYLAILRFMRIKYGENYSKLSAMRRQRERHEKMGITSLTSYRTAYWLLREEKKIKRRLRKYGLVTQEDEQRWERNRQDAIEIFNILSRYYFSKLTARIKFRVMGLVGGITDSLFTGAIGLFFFILGFIGWNLAKLLSVLLIIHQRP